MLLVSQERVVRDVDLEHGADEAVADGTNVGPGRGQSRLDVRPERQYQLHAHPQVRRVHHIDLDE